MEVCRADIEIRFARSKHEPPSEFVRDLSEIIFAVQCSTMLPSSEINQKASGRAAGLDRAGLINAHLKDALLLSWFSNCFGWGLKFSEMGGLSR
jgi:hypothetical protein